MVTALIAILIGSFLLAAIAYDVARLITPNESRCPPLARLRGRRAALEAAEQWLVGLRLHDRVDAATYHERISHLALGARTPPSRRRQRHGVP
ncbi:hypothetical protein [Streptomyces werraensis]|uniref:hypothetical protein n=1 Tax=Streptomyces werraensis TaxID=68284 RepID=UPI0033B76C89